MKTYLISNEGRFYKANLHSHSTVSDGKKTPEELKEIYKSAGYSVLAYSDHNRLIDHSELNDEDFLTFTSMEFDVLSDVGSSYHFKPCYHINFFPKDPHNVTIPAFDRSYENINGVIEAFAKSGFAAMLNHPTWSLQTMEEYKNLDTTHIFAMEIYNHCSITEGYNEVNDHVYDQLLSRGDKLFCTATDDNHNLFPATSPVFDSLGGFVMIKANALTHKDIFDALMAGNFYASNGPEIHEMYIEDGYLTVKTSPAAKITVTTPIRQASIAHAEQKGDTITEAKFGLSGFRSDYIRVTVTDENGKCAWAQPIYRSVFHPDEA